MWAELSSPFVAHPHLLLVQCFLYFFGLKEFVFTPLRELYPSHCDRGYGERGQNMHKGGRKKKAVVSAYTWTTKHIPPLVSVLPTKVNFFTFVGVCAARAPFLRLERLKSVRRRALRHKVCTHMQSFFVSVRVWLFAPLRNQPAHSPLSLRERILLSDVKQATLFYVMECENHSAICFVHWEISFTCLLPLEKIAFYPWSTSASSYMIN